MWQIFVIMSVEQQVTELLSGVDNSSAEKAKTNLELARQEVEKLLHVFLR